MVRLSAAATGTGSGAGPAPRATDVVRRIEALLLAERAKIIERTRVEAEEATRALRWASAAGAVAALALTVAAVGLRRFARRLRESEARERTERARLAGVLGSARDVGWSFRGELQEIRFFGGDVRAMFGVEPEVLENDPRAYIGLIRPEDRAEYDRAMAAMFAGEAGESTQRIVRPDGSPRWLLHRWRARPSQDGPPCVDGISTDLTELKTRELALAETAAALERSNAELEVRVAARTAELAERNEELELLSYSVSHDLRAPLRALDGFAAALLEDEGERLSAEGRDYARRIVGAARRMDELVSDLLEYAQVARTPYPPAAADLGAVVAEQVRALEGEIRRTDADVRVEGPWPVVRAHPTPLGQIAMNLLSNALKFVAPGRRPEVVLRAETHGGYVRLLCEDRGIGVPADQRERIFGMLERLHGRETYPGTGIGLAIVRKAAQRVAGRAGVEDRPGGGSRFWIEILAGDAAGVSCGRA